MTPTLLLALTLALILLPLAVVTWRQGASHAVRMTRAWQSAKNREQDKSAALEIVERRLEGLIEAEQSLLSTVRDLKSRIEMLPTDAPDNEALRAVEAGTESAINRLAELMEKQVDADGQPRLKDAANQLAARHADTAMAIARFEDILNEDEPSRIAAGRGATSPAAVAPAAGSDEAQERVASQADIGLLIEQSRQESERRIH